MKIENVYEFVLKLMKIEKLTTTNDMKEVSSFKPWTTDFFLMFFFLMFNVF